LPILWWIAAVAAGGQGIRTKRRRNASVGSVLF